MPGCRHISPAARKPECGLRGFTLLELLIVLVLLSIMLAYSIPKFQSVMFNDPLKQAARQVIGSVNEARQRAAVSTKGCFLTIAVEAGRLTLFCPVPPTAEQLEQRAQRAPGELPEDKPDQDLELPEGVRILSVFNGKAQRFSSGEVTLWITPRGLMEPSIINLGDGEQEIGLEISPFLPDIRLADQALVAEGEGG